jgi:hypothetical protein
MGTDIYTLPNELLLEILQHLPARDLLRFARVNKRNLALGARTLISRGNDYSSLSRACSLVKRLRRDREDKILIHAFVSRVYDQVITAYENRESNRATSMLKVLDELTAAPEFPKGFLIKIATLVRTYVLQSVKYRRFSAAEQMLDVLGKLPLFEDIPENHFHGAAVMTGACILEDIKRGRWSEVAPMLKLVFKLPLSMTILGSVFAEITTVAQPCIVRACN